jgi:hypothetical protein
MTNSSCNTRGKSSFDLSDLLEVLEKHGVRSTADLEEQLAARFEIVDGPQPGVVELSDEERLSRVSVLILHSISALCELTRIPRTDWGKYFGQIWPVILEDQAKC